MNENMSRANVYCKEQYGYSFISLLLFRGCGDVPNVLASINDAEELLTIYSIVDNVYIGKEYVK